MVAAGKAREAVTGRSKHRCLPVSGSASAAEGRPSGRTSEPNARVFPAIASRDATRAAGGVFLYVSQTDTEGANGSEEWLKGHGGPGAPSQLCTGDDGRGNTLSGRKRQSERGRRGGKQRQGT